MIDELKSSRSLNRPEQRDRLRGIHLRRANTRSNRNYSITGVLLKLVLE